LTPGVNAFAEELRANGHSVSVVDLFGGATFDSLDAGVAHVDEVGMDGLLSEGDRFADEHSAEVVYAGFSVGALIAHKLAQTRPGAKGALLYHYGDVPFNMFGESWPADVPVQLHIAQDDEWREPGVVESFIEAVASGELFEYPGAAHLFTDSSLPEFDPTSRSLVIERTLEFLDSLT
jgi:dienelactone hydrolase